MSLQTHRNPRAGRARLVALLALLALPHAAHAGVDFMIAVQGPDGQAAWAEQYDPKTLEPVAARTHEPAGFVRNMRVLTEYVRQAK